MISLTKTIETTLIPYIVLVLCKSCIVISAHSCYLR